MGSLLDSESLEDVVHNLIFISSIALVGEMVGIGSIWTEGWWCEGDTSDEFMSLNFGRGEKGTYDNKTNGFHVGKIKNY